MWLCSLYVTIFSAFLYFRVSNTSVTLTVIVAVTFMLIEMLLASKSRFGIIIGSLTHPISLLTLFVCLFVRVFVFVFLLFVFFSVCVFV